MPLLSSELSAWLGELLENPNNILKFLESVLAEVNVLENVLRALLTQRSIDSAIGAQLDVLGTIVDEPRNGLSDDDYRRFIRAKVLINRSSGTTPELVAIAKQIINATTAVYVVKNEGPLTVRLRIASTVGIPDALAVILFQLERLAASAGVRFLVQWGRSPDAALFRLDSGPGLDTGLLAGVIGD